MPGNKGFTIIEVMVTLAIALVLAAAGFFSVATLIPVKQFTASARYVQIALTKAQNEAVSRGRRTGVFFNYSGSQYVATAFVDDIATSPYAYNSADDDEIYSIRLKKNVVFSTACNAITTNTAGENCSGATLTSTGCSVFFNSTGEVELPTGAGSDLQIMLVSSRLEAPYNAKEVEVIENGAIRIVVQGQSGSASPNLAAVSCPN